MASNGRSKDTGKARDGVSLPALPFSLSSSAASLIGDLYRRHASDLTRYIQSRFGPGPPEPQDVAQAAFEKFASIEALEDIDNPLAYLKRVAANIVRDHHRTANVRAAVHKDMADTGRDLLLSDITPERVLGSRERMDAFKLAIARMPAVRRRVFLCIRVEGMDADAVARRFNIARDTVYKHVSRAMHEVMAAVDAYDRAEDER